jgi:hypothetical protein
MPDTQNCTMNGMYLQSSCCWSDEKVREIISFCISPFLSLLQWRTQRVCCVLEIPAPARRGFTARTAQTFNTVVGEARACIRTLFFPHVYLEWLSRTTKNTAQMFSGKVCLFVSWHHRRPQRTGFAETSVVKALISKHVWSCVFTPLWRVALMFLSSFKYIRYIGHMMSNGTVIVNDVSERSGKMD